jgi:hypothetical protein
MYKREPVELKVKICSISEEYGSKTKLNLKVRFKIGPEAVNHEAFLEKKAVALVD